MDCHPMSAWPRAAAPLVKDLVDWMTRERAKLSRHNDVAKAMGYMLTRLDDFTGFTRPGTNRGVARVPDAACIRHVGLRLFLCPNSSVPDASCLLRDSAREQRNLPRRSDAPSGSGVGGLASREMLRLGPRTATIFDSLSRYRYGVSFDRRTRHLGIRQVRTPLRSECPDHVLVSAKPMRDVMGIPLDSVFPRNALAQSEGFWARRTLTQVRAVAYLTCDAQQLGSNGLYCGRRP
jgi:hypothetical protein